MTAKEERRALLGCTHPDSEPCFTPPGQIVVVGEPDACGHGDDPDPECDGCYG